MKSRSRKSRQALLILDMISRYDFEGWRPAVAAARRIAPAIARLKARAMRAGVPVIYVNDSAGKWQSDQRQYFRSCLAPGAHGKDVVQLLAPAQEDCFIFKPRHSGFFATPLDELLGGGNVEELILTGTASHQCVLFTAMDAYVRGYRLVTPPDCIGAPTSTQTRHALFILREALRSRTPASRNLALDGAIQLRFASRTASARN